MKRNNTRRDEFAAPKYESFNLPANDPQVAGRLIWYRDTYWKDTGTEWLPLTSDVRVLTCVGDGVTDDTDVFQACVSQGGHWVGRAGATYRLTDEILFVSDTILDLNGATVVQSVGESAFRDIFKLTGSMSSSQVLPNNIAAGAYTFSLANGDGANWAAGDFIVLESDDVENPNALIEGNPITTRSLHKIQSVSGDTVVIFDSVDFPYTTANSAVYYKMTAIENVTLKNFTFTNNSVAAAAGYLLKADKCANVKIENVFCHDFGGGIQLTDCYEFTVRDLTMHRVTDFSGDLAALGYGILAANGSCYGTIDNYKGSDLRHVFTTIGANGQASSGPRHIVISNSVGTASDNSASTSIWDTHAGGYDITWLNCIAQGGLSTCTAWQLRSHYCNLYNCRALHVGGRALSCSDGADHVTWDGGEVWDCGGAGSVATRNYFRLMNVYLHDTGVSSSGYGINGDYCEASNCVFENNAAAGILCSSSAITNSFRVHNCLFIKGSNQTAGIQSPVGAAVKIKDNEFYGYTGAAAIASIGAGTVIQDNIGFKTEAEGATSVADGGTVTHGLVTTPTTVTVTPSTSGEFVSVTAVSSTTFTVAIKKHDNSAGTTAVVYWRASKVY